MTDSLLRVSTAVLALVGSAVSAYLVWVRYSGGELVCTTGGCSTVQSSSYADLLGAPVAVLGLVAYLLIAATALSASPLARAAGASVALAALAFSTYLLVIQVAVIGSVCDWCLASDVVVTLLASAGLLRLREDIARRRPPEGRR